MPWRGHRAALGEHPHTATEDERRARRRRDRGWLDRERRIAARSRPAAGPDVLRRHRQVLVQRLDARIEAELVQEVDEIRRLASGNDPETGRPFGTRIDRTFEVFIARNIPARHEAFLTFLDGRLHLYSPTNEPAPLDQARSPYPLHEDRALAARWAAVEEPARGQAETPGGPVDYLAGPFRVDGRTEGVFVVASFRGIQQADTDAASLAAAIVGVVMLLIGSALAISLADRILVGHADLRIAGRGRPDGRRVHDRHEQVEQDTG